jgi:hypothetical protein
VENSVDKVNNFPPQLKISQSLPGIVELWKPGKPDAVSGLNYSP